MPQYSAIVDSVSGAPGYGVSTINKALVQQLASGAQIAYHMWFPPGTVVNSVSANLQSIGQPAAGLPGTKPTAFLGAINDATGDATQLGATAVDGSASAAAFAAHHAVSVTMLPYTVAAGTHLVLVVTGSVDASPGRWVRLSAPTASVSVYSPPGG